MIPFKRHRPAPESIQEPHALLWTESSEPRQPSFQAKDMSKHVALGLMACGWWFVMLFITFSLWMIETSDVSDLASPSTTSILRFLMLCWLSVCIGSVIAAQKFGWLSSVKHSARRPVLQMVTGSLLGCTSAAILGYMVLVLQISNASRKDINLTNLVTETTLFRAEGVPKEWFSAKDGMVLPEHKQQWCNLTLSRLDAYQQFMQASPSSYGSFVSLNLGVQFRSLHEQGCMSDEMWLSRANKVYNFMVRHNNFYEQRFEELSKATGIGSYGQGRMFAIQAVMPSPNNVCQESVFIQAKNVLDEKKMYKLSEWCDVQFSNDQLATAQDFPGIKKFVRQEIEAAKSDQNHSTP